MVKVKKKVRKDDQLMVRIEKDLKKDFTEINEQKEINNSTKVREWIEDYVAKYKK